jgi:phosphoribosylaminoimidazole-succinocarboxamide synthase
VGSVKDLEVLEVPSEDRAGRGRFHFSDRCSAFDWGEMPDHIEGKGAALCLMGAYFFERLEEMGMATHYLGVVGRAGKARRLADLDGPVDTMEVKLVRVIRPGTAGDAYDYSVYRGERGNFLILLEVIYRNSLPEGSSVFRRLEEGSLRLEGLRLEALPAPDEQLERPLLDVSTKLEATDRYLGWEEAREISGLSSEELQALREATLRINDLISRTVQPWDW